MLSTMFTWRRDQTQEEEPENLLRELPVLIGFCLKFTDSFTCRKLKVKF